jgi:hypothetical protein
MTFKNNYLYRIDIENIQWYPGGAGAHAGEIRVRKGAASVVGQLLLNFFVQSAAGFLGNPKSGRLTGFVKNQSGADITTKLSITITVTVGAISMNLYSFVSAPIIMTVTSLGMTNDAGLQTELINAATPIV